MNIGLGIGIPFTRSSLWASIFTPSALFLDGSTQGVWYDPSDINLTWRRNLLTYSEQFDNAAWTKSNSTVTPNATLAPDGTLTADKLVEDTANSTHQLSQIYSGWAASVSYVFSVYLAKDTRTKAIVLVTDNATGDCRTVVDLVAGTASNPVVTGNWSSATVSITPDRSGFYRVVLTVVKSASGNLSVVPVVGLYTTSNSYTGDGTSGIYIWGAQLEQGSTATPYQRITDGIQDYLQYQAQPVLYQDAAGTLPVTAVEQPVGLMKDKSGGGNHAFNPSGNSANFPVLSARYNLLTKTEDFSDAVWGKVNCTVAIDSSITTPAGTNNASLVTVSTTAFTYLNLASTISTASAASHSFLMAFRAKTVSSLEVGLFDNTAWGTGSAVLVSGPGSLSQVTGAWFSLAGLSTSQWTVVKVTRDPGATQLAPYVYPSGQGTSQAGDSLYIWGADLRVANDGINLPPYQRVNTSTDYDTVGFKPYVRFNGVSQWLQTNSIDFSYGDKMFVCAGVRKLSDAGIGAVLELSTNSNTNNGAIWLLSPGSPATDQHSFRSKGTSAADANSSGYPAPITNVISGIGNISGDQAILRINGTQAATSTSDQGTGNYGNYPLYIGARAGTSLFFNGRLYQLVIAAGSEIRVAEEDSDLFLSESGDFITAETTVAVIQSAIEQTEAFVNRKTKAF